MDKKIFEKSRKALQGFLEEAVELIKAHDPAAVCWVLGLQQRVWSWELIEDQLTRSLWEKPYCSHEARLNDAGLKFYTEADADGKITAYVNGDQRDDHPEAYMVMTMLLAKHGLLPENRLDGDCEPLADWWIETAWWGKKGLTFDLWAWDWVHEHSELLPENVGKYNWS